MRDFIRQARVALQVYLDRGRVALECLDRGDLTSLEPLLRSRSAAFHNFRAADALALQSGYDIAQDAEMALNFGEWRDVDDRLAAGLVVAREATEVEIIKVTSVRQKMSKYRSGKSDVSRFEQSV